MTEPVAEQAPTQEPKAAMRLGLVVHHYREEVLDLARRVVAWAGDSGTVRLPQQDAELIERPELGVPEAEFGECVDLCVSLGGDGTMLRATHLCVADGVPVLGVNVGHLGYLTFVDPDDLEAALDAWCAGELVVEERMLLRVEAETEPPVEPALALNEVVIERAEAGHTVAVDASIGGRRFTNYLADGLIVATPTGSTAYSLSAGGPIVEPNFEALVLTPVAAHMVFDRSMVLAPTTEVKLTVGGYRAGVATVDGRPLAHLNPGDTLRCRAASERAKFVVWGQQDFHAVLKEKFGLVER